MGWMESLIFACAPTDIITAVVTAIRVSRPEALQAIIGRASEGRAVVELELMSSTSAEQWKFVSYGVARDSSGL